MAAMKLKSISFTIITALALSACSIGSNSPKENAEKDRDYANQGIAMVKSANEKLAARDLDGSASDEIILQTMTREQLLAANGEAATLVDGAGRVLGGIANGYVQITTNNGTVIPKHRAQEAFQATAEKGRRIQRKIQDRLSQI